MMTVPCKPASVLIPEIEEAVALYRLYLEGIWHEERFGQIVTKVNPEEIHVERTSSRRIRRRKP